LSPFRSDSSCGGQVGRLDHVNGGQRCSIESKNDSRQPRDLSKKRHSDSLKKSQPALSHGMLRNGVVDNAVDDDGEVKTLCNHRTMPQH
jgi:hypothetical protein